MRASKTASIACCSAGNGDSPAAWRCFQPSQHVVPEHRGEHEARRHRLAFGDARVGVGQREAHELLAAVVALRLVERDVEHREDAAVQAVASSARRSTASAWPVCSSLIISSKVRDCGTLSSSAAISLIGARVLASISKPSLAAKRTTRMMRTGSSR